MTTIPLRLGRLDVGGRTLRMSDVRWLCEEDHLCRPNEIVAFCDLSLTGPGDLFEDDRSDLQVVFAVRAGGRIRRGETPPRGGYLGRVPRKRWSPDSVWAHLELQAGGPDGDAPPDEPDLMFLAGRRFQQAVEDRSGLLTGWHDRKRAWWGDGEGATLLVAGTCEQQTLFRGADGTFGPMFDLMAGPAQIVTVDGGPLASSAAVLGQQLARGPEELAAIRDDMARGLLASDPAPAAKDWLFAGALLSALERSPLEESYDLLARSAPCRAPPAAAVCLSLVGEQQRVLRHRRLGYVLNIYGYRMASAGPAVRAWLKQSFEPSVQSLDDIAGDYRRLVAAARDRSFFIVNRVSSLMHQTVQSYDAMDDATMAGLNGVWVQDLNLMLHDLAREPNVQIIDADAMAADLGIARHSPDAVHASGDLDAEIRAELLHQLQARQLPGLAPRGLSLS